jgi:hypothetical protein
VVQEEVEATWKSKRSLTRGLCATLCVCVCASVHACVFVRGGGLGGWGDASKPTGRGGSYLEVYGVYGTGLKVQRCVCACEGWGEGALL